MGTTHWTSNIQMVGTSSKIHGAASITATDMTLSGTLKTAGSYLQLGTSQFIFFGNGANEAAIVAEATAVSATVKGSLYLNASQGNLWVFNSNTAATTVTTV